MELKPEIILQLEDTLNVEFTRLNRHHNFPLREHTVSFGTDENGDIATLDIGIPLPGLDLAILERFPNLTQLRINENKIDDLSKIKCLPKLKFLDLRNTGLNVISGISELSELIYLNLSRNNVVDIQEIAVLINLKDLNIAGNGISDIEPLRSLKQLQRLDISDNDIRDLSSILSLPLLEIVDFFKNPNIQIDYPPEIIGGGWMAIRSYSENSKDLVTYRDVKVLLLGNSTVGKTSLREWLEYGALTDGMSTHGVIYKNISLDDINYHIWDFGGQEYFHATHRLFFSQNALNIILWTSNGQGENSLPKEYWIRTVEQLNRRKHCLALLVENKTDLNTPPYHSTPINQVLLTDRYKNVSINYEQVSLKDSHRVNFLKDTIASLSNTIITEFQYPGYYNVFRQRILAANKEVVSVNEINSRPSRRNVLPALDLFHRMGFLLYFPEVLSEKVFVKPEALLTLIYQKILADTNGYRITKSQVGNLMRGNSLDLSTDELIKLMKYFDLFFEIKSEKDVFFIPQYLPQRNSWIDNFENEIFLKPGIKIVADTYLMSIAMQKIFSTYGNSVGTEQSDYLFWNNGIVIEKDDQKLLIRFNRLAQSITLSRSKASTKFDLEKEVVDFILDLPEEPREPKRNFNNHVNQVLRKTMDESDPYFSPHGMERLSEMTDEEYHSWMNMDYSASFNWKSSFFDIYLSLNGDYFIEYKLLEKNKALKEVITTSDSDEMKIERTELFSQYLNMDRKKTDQTSEQANENINSETPAGANITYNTFNAPVTTGIIGSGGTIKNLAQSHGVEIASDNKSEEDTQRKLLADKAFKRWQLWALLAFILYLIVGGLVRIGYELEFDFIANHEDWKTFKDGALDEILFTVYGIVGAAFVLKMVYDRYFDPSKKKAFLETFKPKG